MNQNLNGRTQRVGHPNRKQRVTVERFDLEQTVTPLSNTIGMPRLLIRMRIRRVSYQRPLSMSLCTVVGGWDWAPMSGTHIYDDVTGVTNTFSSGIVKSVYLASVRRHLGGNLCLKRHLSVDFRCKVSLLALPVTHLVHALLRLIYFHAFLKCVCISL